MEKIMRNYYAWFNSYGRIATTSFGGHNNNGYVYLAFQSKEEREAWLAKNEWDDANLVAGEITRREIEKDIGKFYVYKNVCVKLHTGYIDHVAEDRAAEQANSLLK